MFEFEYVDACLKKKLSNPEKHFPPEVCQELPQFLYALKQKGEVSKADFFLGRIYKISAHTFDLTYTSDFTSYKIKFIDMKINSLNLFKDRFSITDNWNDNEMLPCIPQYDVPEKILQALELIVKGVDDSYNLGLKLGHKGKHKKYIARHGQYAKTALEELELIERSRKGRKFLIEVTTKGKLIAEALSEDTQKRLLIEAMLNYKPVWLIMGKVTKGGEKLTDKLVLETVFPTEVQDANTSPRRSQTLKNWVKWISSYSGIPIHLQDEGLQLTIPMIYAEQKSE